MTRAATAWLGLLVLAACTPVSSPPATTEAPPAIVALHKSKCARCHMLPEPGLRSRAYLESAAERHARRVNLTSDQWAAMIDYLAAPPGHASEPPSGPARLPGQTPPHD